MKEINIINNESMSLKEIALLIKQRNDKVVQSAQRLVNKGVIELLTPLGGESLTKINHRLNKLDSITLVAQNKPCFTKALVIRWDELERKVNKPMTLREQAELNLKLVIELEVAESAKRKAVGKLFEIGNHLAGSTIGNLEDCTTFNTAAKILSTNLDIKLSHNKLMQLCRENGWLMTGRRSSSEYNMPTEAKIKHFVIKLFYNEVTDQVLITPVIKPSGMVALASLMPIWITDSNDVLPLSLPPETIEMTTAPYDVALWYDIGWTDDQLIVHKHAKLV